MMAAKTGFASRGPPRAHAPRMNPSETLPITTHVQNGAARATNARGQVARPAPTRRQCYALATPQIYAPGEPRTTPSRTTNS